MSTSTTSTSSIATTTAVRTTASRPSAQELRLQGNAFDNHLDWLVGGYYANEKLQVADNLSYGADYDRYANCLVADNFAFLTGQAGLLTPGSATCFNTTIASAAASPRSGQTRRRSPHLPAFRSSSRACGLVNSALRRSANNGFTNVATFLGHPGLSLANTGLNDLYNQTSNNWALFTHNIILDHRSAEADGRRRATRTSARR